MVLTKEELIRETEAKIRSGAGGALSSSAELTAFYLDHCEIRIAEENRFFARLNCEGVMRAAIRARTLPYREAMKKLPIQDGATLRAYTGSYDFGHTSADWQSVISLGIFGLRQRLAEAAGREGLDEKQTAFYRAAISVYDAGLRLIRRAAVQARAMGRDEMADGLDHLAVGGPETLFQAMQTTLIYYAMQHMAEGTYLRTLGRVDWLYLPFYEKETDEAYADGLIRDFLSEIDRLEAPANMPIALGAGGTAGGASNPLTLKFLAAYRASSCQETKIHLLCRRDIPDDVLREAFSAIREGNNSILFLSDEKVIESVRRLGEDETDATDYTVVGCYECGGREELACSCTARVNLPRALEYALTGGEDLLSGRQIGLKNAGDFPDFDSLLAEYDRQVKHLIRQAMEKTDFYEAHEPELYAAPVLSATYPTAVERGRDVYDGGAKYANSSVNAIGLATAVDSLAAIRKLVYEDRTMTLAQLTQILRDNWAGQEALRLRIKRRFPKFGLGDPDADRLARHVVDVLNEAANGKPNAKGGIWRLGLFSIDRRWDFGEKTGASADGRLAGEPLSQNTSASFGADREGATAHILSVASLDNGAAPNGSVLDLDLHTSAVQGENGLHAMIAGLRTYLEQGGFSVHYNVLNTETLKKARAHPEDYPTLQVRLCGWNVLFSTLSDREKADFIARFETQGGASA